MPDPVLDACRRCGWNGEVTLTNSRWTCPQCGQENAWQDHRGDPRIIAQWSCDMPDEAYDNATRRALEVLGIDPEQRDGTARLAVAHEAARERGTARAAVVGRLRLAGQRRLGATVEDQARAEERIPALLARPARVRFLSCEPLLATLDLRPWLAGLDWVIIGGESGPGARPLDPVAVLLLLDDCADAGVPVFMKQAGKILGKEWGCPDSHGARWESWPAWAQRREFPTLRGVSP